VRVIAGIAKGRRLAAPPGSATRPTADRVKEALFSSLLPILGGASVLDLYAGSGALGIEALSRGAAHCTFIERDRTALRTLRDNLDALDLNDRARVVPGDAMVLCRGIEADLVLADPPYGFDEWTELLDRVSAPFLVAESGREVQPVDGWVVQRAKRYGRSWVTFLERADDPGIVPPVEPRQ